MKSAVSVSIAVACAIAATAPVWLGAPAMAAAKASYRPTALDPGGIGGVWIGADYNVRRNGKPTPPEEALGPVMKDANGQPLPVTPWARDVFAKRMQDAQAGHPYATTKSRCLPAGLPDSMNPPHDLPLQILFNGDQVTILLEEFNIFRIIHMNRKHAVDPDPTFFGDSVGHWEGKTLVVDTTGLTTDTTFGNGLPHSEALHIVERFTRTGDRLDILTTIEDPKAFTRPWLKRASFAAIPNVEVQEYFCQGDRNKPDETGRTGVQLKGGN